MSTNASFWSRPRGSAVLGAAACAACCAAPLTASVIGAGAASTVAAIAEPIAGVLLASAAILGIVIYARHRAARAAAAACATDGTCGCGPREQRTLYSSPEPAPESPVACTADVGNQSAVQSGIDEYRRSFAHLEFTERTEHGFRWRFRNGPGLLHAAMVRFADGDRASFREVFDGLWPMCLALATRSLAQRADAEDVAQRALLKVFDRIVDLDRERDGVAWAMAITAFEVLTMRKQQLRRRDDVERDREDEQPSASEQLIAHELAIQVGALIAGVLSTLVALVASATVVWIPTAIRAA